MAGEARKRCLYEVLGVSRDCSQEKIRSAYKRLALQLHPDKVAATGAASSADATAAFQELLHAYEVLSDPKERAWYDSHRSQILFADTSAAKSSSGRSFFDFDLFAFFSNSAFFGYSESGKGFYKVYGDLFAKVYAQELRFAQELGLPAGTVSPAPLIGNLESPYAQVTAFYNYWLGFSTVLDFAWVDEFDSSVGPNRRTRRWLEENNKKLRKKARREYNEAVRGLAAFSKKRDKRVVDMMMKRKQEEEKRREEEKARKKEEERKKMERVRLYEEPDWAKIDQEVDELGSDHNDDDDGKQKKAREELYCVVCNKKFKSEKQWKNHEQSKKHRDKVAELKMTFQEEYAENLDEEHDEEGVQVGFDYEAPASEDSDGVNGICEEIEEDLQLQDEDSKGENLEDKDDEASTLEAMISGRKNRKKSHFSQPELTSNSRYRLDDDDDEISLDNDTRRRGRCNRASRKETREPEAEMAREEKNESQGDDLEVSSRCFSAEDNIGRSSNSAEEVSRTSKVDQTKKQKPKKQHVEVKGTAKNGMTGDMKKSLKGRKQKATSNACETCGESFETRNKLFAHLGATGHAALKSR